MMSNSSMCFDVFREALTLNTGVAQSDNERLFSLLNSLYPLTLKRYASGSEHNGWVIPKDWVVKKAHIKKNGIVLFDGTSHPMAVAGYSSSFRGTVTKEDLDKHIFYSTRFPDAYAFHCMYNYRPWETHWGFCIPHTIYQKWEAGMYEVELDVDFVDGEMIVAEASHEGSSPDTIVFNAHTCHPCQANDDMAGVFVILELFKWLSTQKTRYSYRGILAPEHLGTVFYLADISDADLTHIKLGCFVEMVGTTGPLVLQESFTGDAIIDRVAKHVLRGVDPDITTGAFRTVVGNDETVWEAPGIEIPMTSLSRWPYPEYHTSRDNIDIMSKEKLFEAVEVLKSIISIFEHDAVPVRLFKGLIALSNPKFNLYVERPDPVVQKTLTQQELRLGEIQDILPRYCNGRHTIFELSEKFEIPFDSLCRYLQRFKDKGLLSFEPVTSLDHYKN